MTVFSNAHCYFVLDSFIHKSVCTFVAVVNSAIINSVHYCMASAFFTNVLYSLLNFVEYHCLDN